MNTCCEKRRKKSLLIFGNWRQTRRTACPTVTSHGETTTLTLFTSGKTSSMISYSEFLTCALENCTNFLLAVKENSTEKAQKDALKTPVSFAYYVVHFYKVSCHLSTTGILYITKPSLSGYLCTWKDFLEYRTLKMN